MRDTFHSNDDAVFDRLVDGALSDRERRAFLESLDSRPDGWRRCALAFLEAQCWGGEFRRLAREANHHAQTRAMKFARPSASRIKVKTVVSWAAIAASLLIAFWIGATRNGDVPSGADMPMAQAPLQSAPSNQIVAAPAAPDQNARRADAITLFVRDESGQPRSIQVPLVDANALDRELGVEFRPGVPAHVRSRLQDGGYHVQSKRRYAPLWLENGQQMVLPVEDTRIVPVNQNVY